MIAVMHFRMSRPRDKNYQMKLLKLVLISLFAIGFVTAANAQAKTKPDTQKPSKVVFSQEVRASAAYAELMLVRTELESEVESLLIDHTESFPKIVEDRYHLAMVDIALNRVAAVKPVDAGKLTIALGKILVREAELETDIWGLKLIYTDGHPEVKQAAKKLSIYAAVTKDILGS